MSRNSLVLSVTSVLLLFLSGFLLIQGISPEIIKDQIISPKVEINQTPQPSVLGEENKSIPLEGAEVGIVKKVIDGDTIEAEINGKLEKIRYIGVDTPETVDPRRPVMCFGKEASNENKKLVEGKTIYLTKDISNTDQFGRLLRFIYIQLETGDLLFVNDYLVRQGFAQAVSYPPDVSKSEQFLEAQREAKENGRGLWKNC